MGDSGKNKGGRPTKYRATYAIQAYKLCLLGATNKDLADFFDVANSTIDKWIAQHDKFSGAIKKGRQIADAEVADRLFKRATGYTHKAVKIMQYEGTPLVVPYVEHYAPDTAAAIFWLKNRQPDKWRDKQHHEHEGKLTLEQLVAASRTDSGEGTA